jgi:hypothetical protein
VDAQFGGDPHGRLHLFHRFRLDDERGLVCRRRRAFERIAEFGKIATFAMDRIGSSSCVKRSAARSISAGEGVTAGTACMGMDRISQVLRPGPVSPEPGADAFCYEK